MDSGAPAARALLGAQTQVRSAIISVLLIAVINVLVAVQAQRWFQRSKGQAALKWMRRLMYSLLALEAVHVALLSTELNFVLVRLVGRSVEASAGPSQLREKQLEVTARIVIDVVGATVQAGFFWRGYKITKKVCTKVVLIALGLASAVAGVSVVRIYALSLSQDGPTTYSTSSIAWLCVVTWLCFCQNVAQAWVFYKELIFDRRSHAQTSDPVTEFAVQALSHQAPLIFVTLGASIAVSQFSNAGVRVHGLIIHLYSPVCLLSGLTALLSHDSFKKRYTSSQEQSEHAQPGKKKQRSIWLKRGQPSVHTTGMGGGDDPSFWRADLSHHDPPPMSPVAGIKVEKFTVVEREEDGIEADVGYFSFNLSALEEASPAVTRPSIRWCAETTGTGKVSAEA